MEQNYSPYGLNTQWILSIYVKSERKFLYHDLRSGTYEALKYGLSIEVKNGTIGDTETMSEDSVI